jgi:hypothetical protein
VLLAYLCRDEYNKVSGLDNAKEIGDTLKIAHEGNDAKMISSYGSTRWTDHDVVRLMLRSFIIIDPHLVNLIRENTRYPKMLPEEILGKFVSGHMMVKEERYVNVIANKPLPH